MLQLTSASDTRRKTNLDESIWPDIPEDALLTRQRILQRRQARAIKLPELRSRKCPMKREFCYCKKLKKQKLDAARIQ